MTAKMAATMAATMAAANRKNGVWRMGNKCNVRVACARSTPVACGARTTGRWRPRFQRSLAAAGLQLRFSKLHIGEKKPAISEQCTYKTENGV